MLPTRTAREIEHWRVVSPCDRQYYFAMNTGRWGWWPTTLVWLLAFQPLHAQTDEIQVYTGEVQTPGKFNLTVHANYTPDGRTVVGFPGGVVPQRSLNGAFEWAYGVTDGSRRARTFRSSRSPAIERSSWMGSSCGRCLQCRTRRPDVSSTLGIQPIADVRAGGGTLRRFSATCVTLKAVRARSTISSQ